MSRGGNLFSCLCTMIWSDWNELHRYMPMQQGPRFYILLELSWLFDAHCYEFRDRESYSGFVLPVEENLLLKISYLTYWSWQGASRICFIYQVVHCLKGDSVEYAGMYYEALNQNLLVQKYRGSYPNTFYGLEAYGTH